MQPTRYTRSQVAQLLHVAPKTLYNWEKAGRIEPPFRDARGWRWYSTEQFRALRAMLSPGSEAAPVERITEQEGHRMQISARNNLRGIITSIVADGVTAEVVIDLGHGQEIVSVITRGSVERLGLKVGEPAVALIKATEVMVGK